MNPQVMNSLVEMLLYAATRQLLEEAYVGSRVLTTKTMGAAIAVTTGDMSYFAPRKFRTGGFLG